MRHQAVISKKLFNRFYPVNRVSGTESFYHWVHDYVKKDHVVLDLGAGPMVNHELKKFKGKVKEFIGADIDSAILGNKELDSAFLIHNNV